MKVQKAKRREKNWKKIRINSEKYRKNKKINKVEKCKVVRKIPEKI